MKAKKRAWLIPASILLVSLLLALILWSAGLISIPQFILDYFGSGGTPDGGTQNEALRELIAELRINSIEKYRSETINYNYVEGYRAFSQMKFAEQYSQRYELTYYSGGVKYTQIRNVWRDGDRWRVDVYEDGALVRRSICDGSRYYIKDVPQSEERIYNNYAAISFYGEAALPSTSDLLLLLELYGLPESEIEDCGVTQVRLNEPLAEQLGVEDAAGNYFIVIDFTYKAFGQRDEYVYILDNGLLFKADSYVGDKLIYSLRTQDYSIMKFNTGNDNIFEIPD